MIQTDTLGIVAKVFITYVPFLFALCFHEYAHGFVAEKKGDNTARLMGRLTMNPMAHADLVGTVILPILAIITGGMFFGWAKPVPVNERNLKDKRKDMFWIASAGPLSNILLATISSFILVYVYLHMQESAYYTGLLTLLKTFVQINLALAVFNMIPIHPLDGGKVIARFLPEEINRKLEEHQAMLSMGLLFFFIFAGGVISYPIAFLYRLLISLAERVLM